jgi:hypothetical protein
MATESTSNAPGGFHGSAGSLPLVDLLQVWSMNRFSGLVTVTQRGRSGQLYFVQGEVVHAEAEQQVGEAALLEVLAWADGAFELFPNTTTIHRTIQKRLSHLLLDAHRVLDERRRDQEHSPSKVARPPPPEREARGGPVELVRGIPGVTRVVRFGQDGRPVGDGSAEAEQLAARGLYLAMAHGAAVADAFGLRDLAVATLQTDREGLVLVHSAGQYLCAAVAGDLAADQVAAQVRALLARPVAR